MKIRWHYPAYLDSDDLDKDAEFENQEGLLRLPRIRSLMDDGRFAGWGILRTNYDRDMLLKIDLDGKHWVIGYLPLDHGFDFMRWTPNSKGVTFRLAMNEFRDAPLVEIFIDGQFLATLTAGDTYASQAAVRLISSHLDSGPKEHIAGGIASYEFTFRRD